MYSEGGSTDARMGGSSSTYSGGDGDAEDATASVDPSILSYLEDQAELGGGVTEDGACGELEDPTPDLYAVLGVSRDASEVELKAAYRRLSRLLHPDKHGDVASATAEAAFGRLTAAYNILSDPHKRAIYDQYGFRGLRIQGWELAVRDKSAPELRLEYLLLKQKAKEEERRRSLQPASELSAGLDMTDFFDRYLKEPPGERDLPSLSVYDVSLSQSIAALRTYQDTVSLAGYVTAHNGIGIGTLLTVWNHRFPAKTPFVGACNADTTVYYGRGRQNLGVSVKVNKQICERVTGTVGVELASLSRRHAQSPSLRLAPGLLFGATIEVTPQIVTRLQYQLNLNGGFTSEVFWVGSKNERSCRVQTSLLNSGTSSLSVHVESAVDWPWLNPVLRHTCSAQKSSSDWESNLDEEDDFLVQSMPNKGRVTATMSFNTHDLFEARVGANCVLSDVTRVSSEVGMSWLNGLSLKLGLHRGGQSYVLPIKLSENWDLAAFTYGMVTPGLTYAALRSLLYEPWVLSQLRKAQAIRRERLRDELRKLRSEALATQALMRHTASRMATSEKDARGLVIVKALYGQLSSTTPGVPLDADEGGALSIDVTVPLQVMVENHSIRMPPGRWADMQGFYDPCAGLGRVSSGAGGSHSLRRLFVAYTFNGLPHEVCAEETRGLAIPMSKHRVDAFSNHQ